MSVFKIENLCYSYDNGKNLVLDNINYEFEKGKTYAIVGKSGTGKTTLLSLMSGLDVPKSGKILYNDVDISKINENKYRSNNIGVVFQSLNLLPHLTALENVELSMDISHVKVANKKQHALKMLDKVGLDEEKANRRVLRLSGGEQQRVAIARTLSYNPDVILADEPTGNLDAVNEKQVVQIFKDLAQKDDKCVIIVTHSQNISQDVDYVYNLEKKKLTQDNN
ncbi:MAG: ABC-type antimicrobial peptide transport system, ATPase component [Clostridia bacterium]|jgi:putative ABC transport system ATP-binding protein|nr:ABC-type antimicrobial peptide transport system, ATPase component [Clostridia bacterium]